MLHGSVSYMKLGMVWCMGDRQELGDDITPRSLISKLSLLILHFPMMRLVWSRDSNATGAIWYVHDCSAHAPLIIIVIGHYVCMVLYIVYH